MHLLEVCVDNFESAITAARFGANRLELCQNLSVGGLTPTAGFISVVKEIVTIPVFVLIRPRTGGFRYSEYEIKQMLKDIEISKQFGADGLVFGALNRNDEIDCDVCQRLKAAASGLPVTFHRAFDEISNKKAALEQLIKLGFQRVLTSGDAEMENENGTWEMSEDGIKILQELILKAQDRITVMPGGGISDHNISRIIKETKAVEIHSSGRSTDFLSPTKKTKLCSKSIIHNMRLVLDLAS